eukprot:3126368-Prymnesium_polylepis.1
MHLPTPAAHFFGVFCASVVLCVGGVVRWPFHFARPGGGDRAPLAAPRRRRRRPRRPGTAGREWIAGRVPAPEDRRPGRCRWRVCRVPHVRGAPPEGQRGRHRRAACAARRRPQRADGAAWRPP